MDRGAWKATVQGGAESQTGLSTQALVVKNLPANAGNMRDAGLIPGSGGFPGGRGNPL